MKFLKRVKKAFYQLENNDILFLDELKIFHYESLAFSKQETGVKNFKYNNENIIVSLTSFGSRLNEVHITIESLLNQTMPPNKIVLWLDEKYRDSITIFLKRQLKRGLEIEFCKDIGSYTKLIPCLKMYPKDIIITVDDDIIYSFDFIEHLVDAYNKNPSNIYFYRGHKILMDSKNELKSYFKWVEAGAKGKSIMNFPTGVGGILYPPDSLNKEIFNEEIFLKICPHADDVWFKAMSLMNKTQCVKINTGKSSKRQFTYIDSAIETSLSNINNGHKQNDVQINDVFRKYNLLKILNEAT